MFGCGERDATTHPARPGRIPADFSEDDVAEGVRRGRLGRFGGLFAHRGRDTGRGAAQGTVGVQFKSVSDGIPIPSRKIT